MANIASFEIDEETLRGLVIQYLQRKVNLDLNPEDVKIEVKSKQNYKSEWEAANFRARINVSI